MFAYIKILNGIRKDEYKVIPTKDLRNLNLKKYNKNVKYVLKSNTSKDSNESCIVLLLAGIYIYIYYFIWIFIILYYN